MNCISYRQIMKERGILMWIFNQQKQLSKFAVEMPFSIPVCPQTSSNVQVQLPPLDFFFYSHSLKSLHLSAVFSGIDLNHFSVSNLCKSISSLGDWVNVLSPEGIWHLSSGNSQLHHSSFLTWPIHISEAQNDYWMDAQMAHNCLFIVHHSHFYFLAWDSEALLFCYPGHYL